MIISERKKKRSAVKRKKRMKLFRLKAISDRPPRCRFEFRCIRSSAKWRIFWNELRTSKTIVFLCDRYRFLAVFFDSIRSNWLWRRLKQTKSIARNGAWACDEAHEWHERRTFELNLKVNGLKLMTRIKTWENEKDDEAWLRCLAPDGCSCSRWAVERS